MSMTQSTRVRARWQLMPLVFAALLLSACQSSSNSVASQQPLERQTAAITGLDTKPEGDTIASGKSSTRGEDFWTEFEARRVARAPEIRSELKHLIATAEDGDAEAQYKLALKYLRGDKLGDEELIPIDKSKAEDLFRKSAAGGFAKSHYELGCLIYQREGNLGANDALDHIEVAAEAGEPEALAAMAKYYWNGVAYEQNYRTAWALIQMAIRNAIGSQEEPMFQVLDVGNILFITEVDRCGPEIPFLPDFKATIHKKDPSAPYFRLLEPEERLRHPK